MRYLWFLLTSLLWLAIAAVGCAFLGICVYALEIGSGVFFSGETLTPMTRPVQIYFGITFELLSIICLAGLVILGVASMKKICDAAHRHRVIPQFVIEFF